MIQLVMYDPGTNTLYIMTWDEMVRHLKAFNCYCILLGEL